jgi:DNA invertase Pin-like site-specific DNA recombinase
MLLSFAQFEREITGERIRDKVAASKRKGIWMGGAVPLGYRVENRALRDRGNRMGASHAPPDLPAAAGKRLRVINA